MTVPRRPIPKPLMCMYALLVQLLIGAAAGHAADISQRELMQRLDMHQAPLILDVRRPDEFASGHVPGALNIPHTEIGQRLHELGSNPDMEVVVYCESGRRAAIAADILAKAGFTKVLHLQGDMKEWRARKLPTVAVDPPANP